MHSASDRAAREWERKRAEQRMESLAEFAAKERERKRAEQRMNSTSPSTANGQGSAEALKCRGLERGPCTEMMVRDLTRRMEEKSAEHPALAEINPLRLESPDGTVSCRQKDGNPCTAEQVRSLNEHVAAEMRCNLGFEDPRSDAENDTDTHPATSSDIAAKIAAWENTLDTTNTPSDSAAKERERERIERRDALSESAARERERERIERREALSESAAKERDRDRLERSIALSESAAKDRERERTERKNSPSGSAAKEQQRTERKMTSPSKPAKAPPKGKG